MRDTHATSNVLPGAFREPAATAVTFDARERDPAWDAFVSAVPGGHHVQTSSWGRVKAVLGWRAARVVMRREDRIVAGCQMLIRDVSRLGAIAYAPRGPLLGVEGPEQADQVIAGMHELAARERIFLLKAQTPAGQWASSSKLEAAGFRPSPLEAGPTATVLVDLRRSEDAILAGMRSGTRSNIRKAQRKGVTVRVGGSADLDTFARLIEHTSNRQGFSAFPPRYYRAMWEHFAADGNARLLLAEHEGRARSAILVIAYGDTATYKMGAWSGERGTVHPNELLHWHAMQWARDQGYQQYDFEGIPVEIGRALARGEAPAEARQGTTHFKLGFGGDVSLSPCASDFAYRPLVAGIATRLGPWLSNSRFGAVQRLLGRGT